MPKVLEKTWSARPQVVLGYALAPQARLGHRLHLRVPTLLLAITLLLTAGCVPRKGDELEQGVLPKGAPEVEAILDDLAANDAAIQNFKATGAFTLQSPELAAVQLLRHSTIEFRRPAQLHVIGRKYAHQVAILTCAGPEFLLVFPTEKEFIHRTQGEAFESIDFRVSPSDIAREMFLPEDWDELDPRQIVLENFDPQAQSIDMVICETKRRLKVRRRITVQGPPWVITRSERLDDTGAVLAVTNKKDYRIVDDLRFAADVESSFPGEGAYMRFDMRKIWLNTDLEARHFNLEAQLTEVKRKTYTQVERQDQITEN